VHSEQFQEWSVGGSIAVDPNAVAAPDGSLTADRITITSAANDFLYKGLSSGQLAAATTHTFSFWIKSVDGSSGTWGVNNYNGTSHNRQTVSVTGEWVRVSVQFANTSANLNNIYIADNRDGLANLTDVYVWGAQLEQGSSVTDYYATTGTIKTRGSVVSSGVGTLTGTLTNGVGYNSSNGGSFTFDGDDDYVNLGTISTSNVLQMNDPSGGGLTVSWWGYFNDIGDPFQRIFDKSSGGSATNGWAIYTGFTGETPVLQLGSGGSDKVISNSILTSTWQNWCVTWVKSSETYVTYLNGVQDKTGTKTWNIPSVETDARIGSWNHSTGREYNGKIASLKIYNRALTASEIQQNFNALRGRFGI
jgi:hypothetical protein